MTVRIFRDSEKIATPDLGRLLKDRTGKSELRERMGNRLRTMTSPYGPPRPTPSLGDYADAYGEQVTSNSQDDLRKFFGTAGTRGFTPKGVGTGLSSLAIYPRDIRPSNTAISVLAEGLAGWYLESVGMLPLARPIGEGPDLVFLDSATRKVALVQVKGTQEPDLRARLSDAALGLLDYGSKVRLMTGRATVSCIVVGVVILTPDDFDLYCVETELA